MRSAGWTCYAFFIKDLNMVKNGPTMENLDLLHDKAKLKKDGVYSFRCILYRVKNGRFTHFSYRNEILERCGNFNVSIGFSSIPRKALVNL